MNTYKCPKCETEFSLGTKFCEKCGCNLEVEFIETPTCPKCEKIFPTGTVFCSEDGAKLVSPERMIPKCVKCGKVYTDGTKFCPLDGGKIIPEALRSKVDFDNAKELFVEKGKEYVDKGYKFFSKLPKEQIYRVVIGCAAVVVLVIALILSRSSPGERVARAVCDCVITEIRRVDGNNFNVSHENIRVCFSRVMARHQRHILRYDYWGNEVIFTNPRHQRQFDEAGNRCQRRIKRQVERQQQR